MAKHHQIVAPYACHPPAFVGSTDPATDPDNDVQIGAFWVDTTSGFVLKKRNAADDGWDTLANSAVAALDIDADGTLAANSDAKIATQKAVRTYTDAKVAGLSWKQAVRVATTGPGTLASDFEDGDTVDGVTLATGDRILVKDQASGEENGIYVVAASGAPARATDADSGAELVNASVYVSEGTANEDTQWTCSTDAPITPDTTPLVFTQLTAGGGGIPQTLIDAKGDLVVGASDNTPAKLTVGTDGHVLKANSAATNGVEWAAESGGSATLHAVEVTHNANQTISNTTATILAFNTEIKDTDAFHDTSTNNSRLTVPSGLDGRYAIFFIAHFASDPDGYRTAIVKKNGTAVRRFNARAIDGDLSTIAGYLELDLVATDYVQLEVYHNAGGNTDVLSNPAFHGTAPIFGMHLIGA